MVGVGHRHRVIHHHRRALRAQAIAQHQAGRLTHVIGVGLERQSQHRYTATAQRPQVLFQLPDEPALLQLVDLDHRRQQLEVIPRVPGQLLERANVLGEHEPP